MQAKQRFFQEMSSQGKHLCDVVGTHRYVFRQAQPIAYTYRCVHGENAGSDPDAYIESAAQNGWEYVCSQSGLWGGQWLYFRRAGEMAEDVFFDQKKSVLAYMRRVRDFWLLIGLPVLIICLPGQFNFAAYTAKNYILLGIAAVALAVCGGNALRLTLRMNRLAQKDE